MKMGFGKLILLPLLASIMVLSLGSAIQAKESGWLGVMLQPLTDEIKEAMDLDAGFEGVLVSDVVDDSPAEEHGIEDGDIIIMIDDVKTPTVEKAVAAVKDRSPGEKVVVTVLRDGKKAKIEVELGERDIEMEKIEKFEIQMPDMGHLPKMGKQFAHQFMKPHGYLGVRVTGISEDLGEYFGVDCCEGVLVIEVIDRSPAEYAGLKEGDVILKVDSKEIEGPDGLVSYVKKFEPGEEVEVTYKRKRRTRTAMVELEGAPGQDMFWSQKGPGMCGCGGKDCKGGCGQKCKIMFKEQGGCGHKGKAMCGCGGKDCKGGCGHKGKAMCSCGSKDCKGGCGHKGMGKKMMKMSCGHKDMSQCTKECMEKCKQIEIMGGDGECHMEIVDDEGCRKRIVIKSMDDADGHGEGGKIIIKTEDGVKTIDISDMDIDLDLDDLDLDGLHNMHMFHLQDSDDLEDEIEELQEEIEELKKELKKLKKS